MPKVTVKKMRLSSKLFCNLLKFYTSERTITYFVQLTSRSRGHLEKLTCAQLAKKKKKPSSFIQKGGVALLPSATRPILDRMNPVQSTTCNPISLRSMLTPSSHTVLGLQSHFLYQGFSFFTKALYFAYLCYVSYLPRQPHLHYLHRPTFILWTVQFKTFFIIHTLSVSHYILLLRSNYFP